MDYINCKIKKNTKREIMHWNASCDIIAFPGSGEWLATPPCGRRQAVANVWQSQIHFFPLTACSGERQALGVGGEILTNNVFWNGISQPVQGSSAHPQSPGPGISVEHLSEVSPQRKLLLLLAWTEEERKAACWSIFRFVWTVWNLLLTVDDKKSILWSHCLT